MKKVVTKQQWRPKGSKVPKTKVVKFKKGDSVSFHDFHGTVHKGFISSDLDGDNEYQIIYKVGNKGERAAIHLTARKITKLQGVFGKKFDCGGYECIVFAGASKIKVGCQYVSAKTVFEIAELLKQPKI